MSTNLEKLFTTSSFFFFFLIERLALMKYTNTSRILIYTHREAMCYMCLVDDYLNNN